MIYLDSSAIVKLTHPEPATDELIGWLANRTGQRSVTSKLAYAETIRALRRSDPQALAQVPVVFTRLYSLPIDDRILETASAFRDPLLRTLDAIHLATAAILGVPKLTFVSYDRRLLAAAEGQGFDTLAPGG